MRSEILDFISNLRVCVVAVEMPDGAPHAATVHFAHQVEPFVIVIQTSPKYRKAEPLSKDKATRASAVIGVTEDPNGKDKTFQLDGEAQILESESPLAELYLDKFPEKRGKWLNDVFFFVKPTWWRYTDWGSSVGKTAFNSDGTVTINDVLVE